MDGFFNSEDADLAEQQAAEIEANEDYSQDQEYAEGEEDFQSETDGSDDVLNELMNEDDRVTLESASLRIAQADLYQMLAKHNVFEGVEAPAQVVRQVQKELKEFALERLNILLGISQEKPKFDPSSVQVRLPFNKMEVDVLKDLAYKASRGQTAEYEGEDAQAPVAVAKEQPKAPPRLRPISNASKRELQATVRKTQAPPPQRQPERPRRPAPQQAPQQRAQQQPPRKKNTEPPPLQKAPQDMEKEELGAHIQQSKGRYQKARSTNARPMVSGDGALTMWATRQEQQRTSMDASGSNFGAILAGKAGIGHGVETIEDDATGHVGY